MSSPIRLILWFRLRFFQHIVQAVDVPASHSDNQITGSDAVPQHAGCIVKARGPESVDPMLFHTLCEHPAVYIAGIIFSVPADIRHKRDICLLCTGHKPFKKRFDPAVGVRLHDRPEPAAFAALSAN